MPRRPALLLLCLTALAGGETLELDLQRGHQAGIVQAVHLPQQRLLLTADAAGMVCAWDVRSRLLRWQIAVAGLGVHAVSPDGERLLLGVGYRVELRSLRDGSRLRNINAFQVMTANGMRPGTVGSVAFSRDGRWLIADGPRLQPDDTSEDPAACQETNWYPVDAGAALKRAADPGAIGTDDIDEMEKPALSVPGAFAGQDASGRALVRGGGVLRAVPGPGAGEPVVVETVDPRQARGIAGGRLELLDDEQRFAWTPPGGKRQVLAVASHLPDQAVVPPANLAWSERDGLLVAVGADLDGASTVGAIWRWQLPACTPLPVLTAPGTRGLFLAGDLLLAAAIPWQAAPEGDLPGTRLDLLAWGPQASLAGPGQPFASLPKFPPLQEVRCDATSVWQRCGLAWSRFALADGAVLAAAGKPPEHAAGEPVPGQFDPPDEVAIAASVEQRVLLLAHSMHPNARYEDRLGRPFRWSWIAADGDHGWNGSGPLLNLFVADRTEAMLKFRELGLRAHVGTVLDAALTPDRRHLVTVGDDGIAAVWRLPASLTEGSATGEAELLYRRITTPLGGWLAMTPDGLYAGTRDAIDGVQARLGSEVFPVAQAELTNHRPDLLAERIGLTAAERIAALRRAWELRLRRLGLDPARLAEGGRPQARVIGEVPMSCEAASLPVTVSAEDPAGGLQRLVVTVNGVPVPDRHGLGRGHEGVRAEAEGRRLEATLAVPLAHGANIIEVTAVGGSGLEGPLRRIVVNRTGSVVPRLIVAAVGVSRHADGAFDLRHAAADAGRAARAIAALSGFAQAEVHLLRDGEASRAGILALRQYFAASGPDDVVVLFVAGHGVLDERLDWWFLTHAGDPERPAAGCVAYHELEGLLDGIPAQRRLLLMDTCHAGEVDAAATVPVPGLAVRAVRGLKPIAGGGGSAEDAALMREVFIDLRRAAGAVVIAASAGQEVAFEDDRWQGGAFTRALLDALADPAADRDGDHGLSALEWRTAVAGRVSAMTGGLQRPVQRADNPLARIILRRW